LDGILNINKPAGQTSFDIVAAVKRITREKHVGHAGTLDPDATGVLPVCLGKGTRIIEFLMDAHKVYRAIIELGISTDSYDGAGKVIRTADASKIDKSAVVKALEAFHGAILQTPPMYSALKQQGRPLYALAREGITVERSSRPVTIHKLEMLDWQPPLLTLEIECSKGTYIRSIANDLGEALGCGAYLKNLVRSAYGAYKIEDAVTPEQLESAVKRGDWRQYLHPIDSVLGDLPSVTVDAIGEAALKTGNPPAVNPEIIVDNEAKYLRAYSTDGRFLAILTKDKENSDWRPKKVFIQPDEKPPSPVIEDKNGAYKGVRPEFLKQFVCRENNPNFEAYDTLDGKNRFIAAKCCRLPDDEDINTSRYGINFHRAKPDYEEALRYHGGMKNYADTRHLLSDMAFTASTRKEYDKKAAAWDAFYGQIWGGEPLMLWVTPHSGAATRPPDYLLPWPELEPDARVAGVAAACALSNSTPPGGRFMTSIHSHNWLGAVLDVGRFGNIDEEKLAETQRKIETAYHDKIQFLAADAKNKFAFISMRWLNYILETKKTLNPHELAGVSTHDEGLVWLILKSLELYGHILRTFTLLEFEEAIKSLDTVPLQAMSCGNLFPGKVISRLIELPKMIEQKQMSAAVQIECNKVYLKKAPELITEMILAITQDLFHG
jgi:tRNA pseudouridine55 synthase